MGPAFEIIVRSDGDDRRFRPSGRLKAVVGGPYRKVIEP
jgi:hypothetical protein